MRIAIATNFGQGYGLSYHSRGVLTKDAIPADITILDDPAVQVNGSSGIVLNQSYAMRVLAEDQESLAELVDILGITEGETYCTLYGLFNGERFGQLVEISQTTRFMDREVGPDIGFAHGAALKVDCDPHDEIDGFDRVIGFLQGIGYRGEVSISLDADTRISGLLLQHMPSYLAMYRELAVFDVKELVEFAAGKREDCELHQWLSMAVLVTQHPYPVLTGKLDAQPIAAPGQAESHLWRMKFGEQEVVLVTARSNDEKKEAMRQARKRIYRTIQHMNKLHGMLQYRTDAGRYMKFLLTREKYEEVKIESYNKHS